MHRQQACGAHQIGIAHRATWRRGRAELVAGDGLSGGGHGGVGELFAAGLMMPPMRAGVKARAAHRVLGMRRGVPEYARDELVRAQVQRLALLVAVAGVVEAHTAVGQIQYPVIGQGSAPGVARQVQRNPAAMGVGRRDLDVPVFAVLLRDRATPVLRVLLGWQVQALGIQRVFELCKELAPQQQLQRAYRHQEVAVRGPPLAGAIDASGACQAMHVGMAAQRAPPGVQRHQQPGPGAQVARVGAQRKQALACTVKQQLVHPRAVELPQRDEHVWQREDEVKVRARQQLLKLRLYPLLARLFTTARAAAMAARVVLHHAVVGLGAGQHMASEGGAVAVADALRRAQLARVQHMRVRKGGKVLAEDRLHGAAHGTGTVQRRGQMSLLDGPVFRWATGEACPPVLESSRIEHFPSTLPSRPCDNCRACGLAQRCW